MKWLTISKIVNNLHNQIQSVFNLKTNVNIVCKLTPQQIPPVLISYVLLFSY